MSRKARRTKKQRKCPKCRAYCQGKPTLCGLFAQGNRFQGFHRPEGWPIQSLAMGVHPKQLKTAMKRDRERCAPPTEYVPSKDGYTMHPVFTSENHKRAFIKAHKFIDQTQMSRREV